MRYARNAKTGCSPVQGLSALLTPQQVSKFVQKAVIELKLRQAALSQSLENQQWEISAEEAHRIKSTVGLFSADSLVKSLDLIESGEDETILTPAFRQSLAAQCEELIDGLERYLNDCPA